MATVPKRPLGVTLTSTDVPDHVAWLAALRSPRARTRRGDF